MKAVLITSGVLILVLAVLRYLLRGRISLRLHDLGDRAEITITDNGVGIPEEDIPHLFERFYRVEKARSSDKGGTGLGLAIAKEFAVAHGGDIRVSSIVGKGTTFTVTLPKQGKL